METTISTIVLLLGMSSCLSVFAALSMCQRDQAIRKRSLLADCLGPRLVCNLQVVSGACENIL